MIWDASERSPLSILYIGKYRGDPRELRDPNDYDTEAYPPHRYITSVDAFGHVRFRRTFPMHVDQGGMNLSHNYCDLNARWR